MFKYTDTEITFSEFPDEISLCINISGCPIHCPDCHSKELWENVGKLLMSTTIIDLIEKNKGITCVGFMGGAQDIYHLLNLVMCTKHKFPDIKIGWYTGQSEIPELILKNLEYFDYIKIGPYIKEKGGLDNPNTNQKFYEVIRASNKQGHIISELIDTTYKFRKNV